MKNRKREICTSGSVRDEDGNILIYSASRPPPPATESGAVTVRAERSGAARLRA
jgi:hypothetical protein